MERSINEFKEVEELLEQFEDTTLNEGNITGLPSRKGWGMFWEEKLKKYITNDASVSENNTVDANVYFMPAYFICLLKCLPHIALWNNILEEHLSQKMTSKKWKLDRMTNANVELYFKLKKANKEDINLSVEEFILKSHESRKSNQKRFVQKFCEEAYKDSKRKDIISKRNIRLLSSFFIEKNAACENGENKKDQATEKNTAEKTSSSIRKRKRSEDFIVNLKSNKKRDVNQISNEKSLHHNDNNGNLSNLKNLNGLTENESQNLEKGSCIQYDEKDCLKLEEGTWLKLTPKNNDLKKTFVKKPSIPISFSKKREQNTSLKNNKKKEKIETNDLSIIGDIAFTSFRKSVIKNHVIDVDDPLEMQVKYKNNGIRWRTLKRKDFY